MVRQAAKEGATPSSIKMALLTSAMTGKDFNEVLKVTRSIDREVNEVLADL